MTQVLKLITEADMAADVDLAIRRLLSECFPADAEVYARTRAWQGNVPAFSVICCEDDLVLGHLAVVTREILCATTPVTVAGIEGVCVAPPERGTGIPAKLMARATDEAAGRGIRFGMLFCVPELEAFYGRMGWTTTGRTVTMLDAHGRPAPTPAKNITMHLELAGEPLPPGPVDLQGRDW